MNVLIIVLTAIILLLLLISLLQLEVKVNYYHNGDDDELYVRVRTLYIITYTFKAPLIKIDPSERAIIVEEDQELGGITSEKKAKITIETILRDIREAADFLKHVAGFHKIVRYLLKRMKVSNLEWKSHLGISDAAWTGVLAGMAWTVKGGVVGVIRNYMQVLEKPIVEIVPNFQATVSHTNFKCMIRFRLGHAIIAALLIVRHWKRRPVLFRAVEENA